MKKIFFIAVITALIPLLHHHSIAFGSEVKKVCVDKVTNDGKKVLDREGKPVQDCKEIKVHKKLEGTQVPPPDKK
jgi:hypothetical protein